MIIFRGIIGIIGLMAIALAFSRNRKAIKWNRIALALLMQVALAVAILYIPFVEHTIEALGRGFIKLLDFTKAGSTFLLGGLVDMKQSGYIFLFQVLPSAIFFAALTSIMYYYGIIQRIVSAIAYVLRKTLGISGAEGLVTAGNIFLGQCESPLLTKKYLPSMSSSELFLVMTSGMATIAGGVMSAYILMLGSGDSQATLLFAKHLISASVLAAPAAIIMAKIIFPETQQGASDVKITKESVGSNLFDALSNGTLDGLRLVVNIAALLLVFIAMIAMLNYCLSEFVGSWTGLNALITSWSGGQFTTLSLEYIFSLAFTPVAWLIGVQAGDIPLVASLLGKKLAINEFVAYVDLNTLKNSGAFLSERSIILSTYVLCGFANISSIGMLIGGIGSLAPNKKEFIARYGTTALVAATLASCLSATIIGMLI